MKYSLRLRLFYQNCFLNITMFLNFLSKSYCDDQEVHALKYTLLTKGLNRGSGTIANAPYFPFLRYIGSEVISFEFFHQTFKLHIHFFRKPCRLLLCLFLEVIKCFFRAAALSFSICIICSFGIL